MGPPVALGEKDLLALLALINDHRGQDPGDGLPLSMLEHLKAQVPSDSVSLFGLDSGLESAWFSQDLPADVGDGDVGAFWAHYWHSMPCSYPDQTGDLRSVTQPSDFYSARQWHSSGMYCDYMRPAGLEHELMLCLPAGPGRTVRLIFFRGPGRGFSERDRALLILLRPHLVEAYAEAELRRGGVPALTPRQWALLRLVAAGYTNAQIARRLAVSESTVRKHLENIYLRLRVSSRTAAVTRAFPLAQEHYSGSMRN
jgi:DNA-binding CsgD family transcriptional regulator